MSHTLPNLRRVVPVSESPIPQLVAPVQEVFSSVQGEGVYVGKRQVFVRFAHCHLKCAYCDTPMTTPDGMAHMESLAGTGYSAAVESPMTVAVLAGHIERLLDETRHHSVSFTGGEPLLYHRFLAELMPLVQQHSSGVKTYLETSGTQPDLLIQVLPYTDIIAMDIKLPSATGERAYFEEHAEFLRVATTRPQAQVFIKLIFGPDTPEEEWQSVETTVKDKALPIILQPVTSLVDRTITVSPAQMLAAEARLSKTFADVRLIPQTHKMLSVQ